MKKVKLGMIGCGLCATTMHTPAINRLTEQFEVVNVVSRNSERAAQFADRIGSPKFCTDYHKLLADPEVEAVVITYPFEVQSTVAKEALDAGKHVMVEKPLAPSLAIARDMVAWEKATDKVTMIAENFRYRQAMLDAKKYIERGTIGAPRSILYICYGNMDRQGMWLKDSKWRWNSIGGVMLDRNVHYTAVLRLLMGEAKGAIGSWDRMCDDVGPMDTIHLHVVFENGAIGSLVDYASVTGLNRREIIVIGEKGTAALTEQCTKITVTNTEGFTYENKYPTDRLDSVVREYEDFYSAIVDGTAVHSSWYDGYKDLQLALTPLLTKDQMDALTLPE